MSWKALLLLLLLSLLLLLLLHVHRKAHFFNLGHVQGV